MVAFLFLFERFELERRLAGKRGSRAKQPERLFFDGDKLLFLNESAFEFTENADEFRNCARATPRTAWLDDLSFSAKSNRYGCFFFTGINFQKYPKARRNPKDNRT